MGIAFTLSLEEQEYLGRIARQSIDNALHERCDLDNIAEPQEGVLREHLGCFVTLTLNDRLRGCIGSMVGHEALWCNAARMAQAAALNDPRFPPLSAAEWPHVRMEISVLGPLTPCPDPQAVEIGRHGLLLQCQGKSGVFLPKVPVEQGWDLPAYLENLCRKAGLPAGSWKLPEAKLYWYEALVFAV